MRLFGNILSLLVVLCLTSLSTPATAEASLTEEIAATEPQSVADIVGSFTGGKFAATESFIDQLAATGDSAALVIFDLLEDGSLRNRKSDGRLVIATKADGGYALSDPITGEELGVVGRRDAKKVKVNNRIRRALGSARGRLTLLSPDPQVRAEAAQAVFVARNESSLETLQTAISSEQDADILAAMQQAEAAIQLLHGDDVGVQIAAVDVIVDRGDEPALSLLLSVAGKSDGALKEAADVGAEELQARLDRLGMIQNIWFGISLGSVLLLAAIGLAITFGVMGVINMAHGELVMLGAYTTFVVQGLFATYAPDAMDYAILVALPAAFLVAGGVGVGIERSVIRFLYGRPLETLLATWGLSLILQQTIRSIFGSSNVEVSSPGWMSGTVDIVAGLSLTQNRMWIVVFAIIVFGVLMLVINRSSFGLKMRAVTQNRRMANAVGIRSNWVDAMTFGLGSGVAGIAGVALSQIANVSPNLGQSYIIDSFLVVVFGGVGNLWGTLVGAMSLGIFNKFLEPMAGAVLAKILILVAVILFIQRRPMGLFAQRGRAVEN